MSQRWRTAGNTVSELTGPRFELLTSRSSDKRVTARPTRSKLVIDEDNEYLWSNHKLFRRLLFVEVLKSSTLGLISVQYYQYG